MGRRKRTKFKRPDFSNARVRRQMGLYGAALAIGGLFFVSAALPLASNPTFCGKACHNMAPQWESWKRSAHSEVTCYACHIDVASPTHLMKEKLISGPLGIFNTVLNRHEKPINAESLYSGHLPTERCERCHANTNRKFTFSRGIKMNHEAHKEAGIACAVCHNRVAHKGAEEYEPLKSSWPETKGIAQAEGEEQFKYKDFLGMKDGCFRCHSGSPESRDPEILHLIQNGKEPPQACPTCHTEDSKLPEGHGSDAWRAEHGAVAKQDIKACFECHAAGAAFDDHGKPWCGLCHDESKVKSFLGEQPDGQEEPAPEASAPAPTEG